MDDRTFTTPNGATLIYLRPKHPDFEAIGADEVATRIRDALPEFDDDACVELASALTLWAPQPAELNTDLAGAIGALQAVSDFLSANEATEHSIWKWRELRRDLLAFTTRLHRLRDAVDRACDHKVLEPDPEHDRQRKTIMETAAAKGHPIPPWQGGGSRRCTSCGTGYGPGSEKPPRSLLPREYYPKYASRQRPARSAFLYFATELLRRRGLKKLEAMKLVSKVIDLFWNDDDRPYAEAQLEDAHQRGKASSEQNHFVTAQEFAEIPLSYRWEAASGRLVWVRLSSENFEAEQAKVPSDE